MLRRNTHFLYLFYNSTFKSNPVKSKDAVNILLSFLNK